MHVHGRGRPPEILAPPRLRALVLVGLALPVRLVFASSESLPLEHHLRRLGSLRAQPLLSLDCPAPAPVKLVSLPPALSVRCSESHDRHHRTVRFAKPDGIDQVSPIALESLSRCIRPERTVSTQEIDHSETLARRVCSGTRWSPWVQRKQSRRGTSRARRW